MILAWLGPVYDIPKISNLEISLKVSLIVVSSYYSEQAYDSTVRMIFILTLVIMLAIMEQQLDCF
jgi:hypothetical protein